MRTAATVSKAGSLFHSFHSIQLYRGTGFNLIICAHKSNYFGKKTGKESMCPD